MPYEHRHIKRLERILNSNERIDFNSPPSPVSAEEVKFLIEVMEESKRLEEFLKLELPDPPSFWKMVEILVDNDFQVVEDLREVAEPTKGEA